MNHEYEATLAVTCMHALQSYAFLKKSFCAQQSVRSSFDYEFV